MKQKDLESMQTFDMRLAMLIGIIMHMRKTGKRVRLAGMNRHYPILKIAMKVVWNIADVGFMLKSETFTKR